MTLKIRLSPSGPEIGTPGAQVGGSAVEGRVWGKTGVGADDDITDTETAVAGLESVPVDVKKTASGYRYDVECDINSYGTGTEWKVALYGSSDGGATFPTTLAAMPAYQQWSGPGRLHLWGVQAGAADIDHVRMTVVSSVPTTLTYAPVDSTVRITEVSPVS